MEEAVRGLVAESIICCITNHKCIVLDVNIDHGITIHTLRDFSTCAFFRAEGRAFSETFQSTLVGFPIDVDRQPQTPQKSSDNTSVTEIVQALAAP